MCRRVRLTTVVLSVFYGLAPAEAYAGDQELLQEVEVRILGLVQSPDPRIVWPPQITIEEGPGLNATTDPITSEKAGVVKKVYPRIFLGQELMDRVVEGQADRLAYVLGHELSHVTLGHLNAQLGLTGGPVPPPPDRDGGLDPIPFNES